MLTVIDPGTPAVIHGYFLNDHMRRLSAAAAKHEPLKPVMAAIVRELGFESFMYGMSADPSPARRETHAFAWSTLPDAWLHHYGERGYIEIDPRVTCTYHRNVPYVWEASALTHDPLCREFLRDAAAVGIASGVAISFRDPDHGRILVALDSPVATLDEPRKDAIAARLGEIVLLAMAFHDFFMAHLVNREPTVMVRVGPLSPREAQCLELAANGMTSEDIALKLGIKPRTANFHFGKIVSKLGVLNRKEAIAFGMARGLIRPNPLTMGRLPPRRLQPKASGTGA